MTHPAAGATGRVAHAPSWASSAAVRRNMIANRRRDTNPELEVRRLLHRAGLRYRVDVPLPFDRRRRVDILFPRVGLYVFIDGCFWHACPQHYVEPRSHTHYWQAKVRTNTARDADTTARLTAAGFHVLRIWEHEVPAVAASEIEQLYTKLLKELRARSRDPVLRASLRRSSKSTS